MSDLHHPFEERIRHELRAWTEPVDRARPWTELASAAAARAAPRRQPLWRMLLLGAGTAAAAIVVTISLVDLVDSFGEPSRSGFAAPSGRAALFEPSSPAASAWPDPASNLGAIAWWDLQSAGWGDLALSIFEPPNPTSRGEPDEVDRVNPQGFRQIRVGTLDGRVTALLAVSEEWSHSYVSGPVHGEVLVVDDLGTISTVRTVTASTGAIRHVVATPDRITAAALAPALDFLYYVRVDRASGVGPTVWQLNLTTFEERQLDAGAEGFGAGQVDVTRLGVSPDGATLVVQFCFGQVECETHIIDISDGTVRETDRVSWLQGFDGRLMYARRIAADDFDEEIGEEVTLNLDTLQVVPARDIPFEDIDRIGRFSADLPLGSIVKWPDIHVESFGPDPRARGGVRLRDPRTGDVVTTPPLTVEWPTGCEPIPPGELPTGSVPGGVIHTFEGETRWSTYGQGEDLVIEGTGLLPAPPLTGEAEPVTVRGHAGHVVSTLRHGAAEAGISSELVPPIPALQWEEGDCWYQAQLPALTFDEAIAYASRF